MGITQSVRAVLDSPQLVVLGTGTLYEQVLFYLCIKAILIDLSRLLGDPIPAEFGCQFISTISYMSSNPYKSHVNLVYLDGPDQLLMGQNILLTRGSLWSRLHAL